MTSPTFSTVLTRLRDEGVRIELKLEIDASRFRTNTIF
jgi:hypothetical protein